MSCFGPLQRWEMRKQIVTGKQNYLQIMIESGLRISFVRSMSDDKHLESAKFLYLYRLK